MATKVSDIEIEKAQKPIERIGVNMKVEWCQSSPMVMME